MIIFRLWRVCCAIICDKRLDSNGYACQVYFRKLTWVFSNLWRKYSSSSSTAPGKRKHTENKSARSKKKQKLEVPEAREGKEGIVRGGKSRKSVGK